MGKRFGFGGLFHKAPREEEESATQAIRERLTREGAATGEAAADELDTRFREALADGEITGDIVAVDAQGREVKGRKRSSIFDT